MFEPCDQSIVGRGSSHRPNCELPCVGAQTTCQQPGVQQLIVYHAGSLSAAFGPVEQAFTCQTGVQVQDVTGGSVDLVRQVTAGGKPADIVASADYVDIDNFLKPAGAATYDILFACGRMVLAYTASDVGSGGKNLPPIVDPAGPSFDPPDSATDIARALHASHPAHVGRDVTSAGHPRGCRPGICPTVGKRRRRSAVPLRR